MLDKLSSSEDTKQSGSIDEAVNFFVVFFLFLKGVRFGKSKLQWVHMHFSSETTIRHRIGSATYLELTRDYALSMFLRISFVFQSKKRQAK